MNEINDIYEFRYGSRNGGIQYAGTLRNERKFNLHQDIFFSEGGEIVRGTVIGIKIEQCDNPNYLYEIKIPEKIVMPNIGDDGVTIYPIRCDQIFDSLEQAKASALKRVESDYKLGKESVERYFNQFIYEDQIQTDTNNKG